MEALDMHEWSIAESVVETLKESFKGRRVLGVEVKVGELRGLDLEILREALKIAAGEAGLGEAKFNVTVSRACFRCLLCGREWGLREALIMMESTIPRSGYVLEEEPEPPTHFIPGLILGLQACPGCGGMDIDLVSGKELEISRVEVE